MVRKLTVLVLSLTILPSIIPARLYGQSGLDYLNRVEYHDAPRIAMTGSEVP